MYYALFFLGTSKYDIYGRINKNICPLGSSPEHQFVVQMNGNNATRYHIGVIDYKVFSLLPLNIEYRMNI